MKLRRTFRSSRLALVCALPLLALSACGDGGSPPVDPSSGLTPRAVSGAGQAGLMGRELAEPLVVEAIGRDGAPAAGLAVTWSTTGGGTLSPATGTTDAQGRASTRWTLGPSAGEQSASATLEGVPGALRFTATARAPLAASIAAASDTAFEGLAGEPLAEPLAVRVLDDAGAPLEGVEVEWTAVRGGGAFSPARSATDAEGVARAGWTLGEGSGVQEARAVADTLAPLSFRALSAVSLGAAGGTVGSVGGAARLEVPAGALPGAQAITVTRSDAGPGAEGLLAGTRYEFGPDGLVFESAVTLSLAFDPAALPEGAGADELAVHLLSGGAWVEVAGSRVNLAAGVVTVSVEHFSVYALLVRRGPASLEVSPGEATVSALGVGTHFTASLLDAGGNALDASARRVEWSSSDEAVATVDASGRAEAVGAGEATITARSGQVSGAARLVVEQVVASVDVEPEEATLAALGDTLALSVRVEDVLENRIRGVEVEWESEDAAVATVDDEGKVTAVGVGTTTVWGEAGGTREGSRITVAPVAAALRLDVQPSEAPGSGAALARQPVVRLVDANGHPVGQAGVEVSATVEPAGTVLTGTDTVSTDAQGVATFSGLTLSGETGTYVVIFRADGVDEVYSANVTLGAGAAAALAKAEGDGQSAAVGTAVPVAPEVRVTDASGNPVSGVEVTFAVASGGGSVGGGVQTTASDGTATVGSWTLGTTAGASSLEASAPGLGSVTFGATGTAGAATRLVLVTAPGDTATQGVAFAAQPVVRLEDAAGNAVGQAGVPVTASVDAGGGTVGGTATVQTDASGEATFTDLSIGGGTGAHTLALDAGGLTGATADVLVIGAPSATADAVAGDSEPGDALHGALDAALSITNGAGDLLANDTLGGGAEITHFGAIRTNDGAGTLNAAAGTVTTNAAGSTVTLGDGSLTVEADGTLSFDPPTGYTGLLELRYRLGNAAGSSDATVTLAVGERPQGVDDEYDVLGNVQIGVQAAAGLLANDGGDDLHIDTSVFENLGGTGTGGAQFGLDVGTGEITHFRSSPGYEGEHRYRYTIGNGFGTSQATVTFDIERMIWFVDADASSPGGGNGRINSPFTTLEGFIDDAADEAGDVIFLHESATGYTGGITLKDGQRLIGQDATQPLDSLAGVTVPAHSAALPAMNPGAGDEVVLGGADGGVVLGEDNQVHGLRIDISSGTGLDGTGFGTLTVHDASIESGETAIDLNGVSGVGATVDLQLASTTAGGGNNGVHLANVGGQASLGDGSIAGASVNGLIVTGGTVDVSYAGSITHAGGRAVLSERGTGGSLTLSGAVDAVDVGIRVFDDGRTVDFTGAVTVDGTGTGVTVQSLAGGTVRFTGGLDVTAPTGVTATGSGTLEVTGTGNTVTATAGHAIQIDDVDIGSDGMTFASLSSTGGTHGVRLDGTGSGPLSVTGTVGVTNPTGAGIVLDGARTSIAGATTITSPGGAGIDIDDATGAISFGDVTITGRGGVGIDVDGASGLTFGTVEIDNPSSLASTAIDLRSVSDASMVGEHLIDMGTGAAHAIDLTSATLDLEGGTLRNADDDLIKMFGSSNLGLREVVLERSAGAIYSGSGQIDISGSTIRGMDGFAIQLGANIPEHRVRIRESRIEDLGIGVLYAGNSPFLNLILEDVTFGAIGGDLLYSSPGADVGTGVCISLLNTVPDSGTGVYELDATHASNPRFRYEEPDTGVVGTVNKSAGVEDVPRGTCPAPSW